MKALEEVGLGPCRLAVGDEAVAAFGDPALEVACSGLFDLEGHFAKETLDGDIEEDALVVANAKAKCLPGMPMPNPNNAELRIKAMATLANTTRSLATPNGHHQNRLPHQTNRVFC